MGDAEHLESIRGVSSVFKHSEGGTLSPSCVCVCVCVSVCVRVTERKTSYLLSKCVCLGVSYHWMCIRKCVLFVCVSSCVCVCRCVCLSQRERLHICCPNVCVCVFLP